MSRQTHFANADKLLSRLRHLLSAKPFPRNFAHSVSFLLLIALVFSVCVHFSLKAVIIDSDSGFEYTNAQNVLQNKGLEHGPVVHQLLYALLLGVFGLDHRNILVFQSVLTTLMVLVTFLLVRRKTNFGIGIVASLLFFFLPIFFLGTYILKPYPLFLLLLMVSIYCLDLYIENRRSRFLLLSAVSLGVATMTHLLSLPFAAFMLVYYILARPRDNTITLNEVAKFYFMLVLVVSPYLAWRIMVDGFSLDLLLTYPARWYTIKYAKLVNIEYWGMPLPFTYEYGYRFLELLVTWGFLPSLSLFLLFGLVKYRDKELLVSWFLVLLAPFLIGRGVFASFYVYPFIPLIVSLSAQGIYSIARLHNSKRITIVVIGLMVALALANYSNANTVLENRMKRDYNGVQDAEAFNRIMTKGSNILSRSRALSPFFPEKNVLQIQDLSEEDALIYLGWKNDEEVARVFMEYNISYVILYKDVQWEKDYHVWFKLVTGYEPSHFLRIDESQFFRRAEEGDVFILYEFSTMSISRI